MNTKPKKIEPVRKAIQSHLQMVTTMDKDVERAMRKLEKKIHIQRQKSLDMLQKLNLSAAEQTLSVSALLKKKLRKIRKYQRNLADTSHKNSIRYLRNYFNYLQSIIELEILGK